MNSIRVSQSVFGQEEIEATKTILEKGFVGMGPETKTFEDDLRYFIGSEVEVVCVSTGTAALQLAVQACGIGFGDEVLIPTFTYVASFQAVSATGATPVACDIDLETGCIDIKDLEKRITLKTKAIMPVHYASQICNVEALQEIARKYNLRIIEDAAHAFGCKYNNQLCGSFGDITCFSFDGIKNITSGEGGAVVTRDHQVANTIRDLRLLGVQGDTAMRIKMKRSWDFEVAEQGWRYHMSDLMAAIGRVQLKKISYFSARRVSLACQYQNHLADVKCVEIFPIKYGAIVPHIFPIRVREGKRDSLKEYLNDNGVQTGLHYKPNHFLSKFKTEYLLPNAEKMYAETLTLPLHPAMDEEQVSLIIDLIRTFNNLNERDNL